MTLLSHQQIEQVSSAIQGLDSSQIAWVSGYLAGLSSPVNNQLTSNIQPIAITNQSVEKVTVLYGSQTGNSKNIAEELHNTLISIGVNSTLNNLLDYRPSQLKKEQKVFFIISTQGNGEPPDEALKFIKFIESDRAPTLEKLEYAVLGLGDSSYDEYCQTGVDLDARMNFLGAKRLVDRVDVDLDFEDESALWQKQIIEEVEVDSNSSQSFSINASAQQTPSQKVIKWSESNPYQAEVLDIINLTDDGSTQEAFHIELGIEDYGDNDQNYKAGDILALKPINQKTLVDEIIKQLGFSGTENVHIKNNKLNLHEALSIKLDINKLTNNVVKAYATTIQSKELLEAIEKKEQIKDFIHKANLLDLVKIYSGTISAQVLVDNLRPLISRQYSIASSTNIHTDEVHILVKPFEYHFQNQHHIGSTSSFVKQLQTGDTVSVHIKSNSSFKLPNNPDDKIIMIGAGTGVAPYRSFLFEREAQGATGNSWLIFGEQHFHTDFLYQTDWQKFLKKGVLERMNVAFSRDQTEKIYVQHKLLEEAKDIYQWLKDGATLYVCGDINYMAADVHKTLIKIISSQSSSTLEEAEVWLEQKQFDKKYQRDVY